MVGLRQVGRHGVSIGSYHCSRSCRAGLSFRFPRSIFGGGPTRDSYAGFMMQTMLPDSEMWAACERRDESYDGLFVLAVKTTSIFCRPTCAARSPKRANVEFFATGRDALTAGYRPCKRCRPMDVPGKAPNWVQRLIDRVDESPESRIRDADLRAMNVDPARARRFFNDHYGMTFQAYQRARRLGSAKRYLQSGDDLTRTGFSHGFESLSGFRDAFVRLFGAPPGKARTQECLYIDWMSSPIGPFIAGATDHGVCLYEFADRHALETQIASVRKRFKLPALPSRNEHIEQLDAEMSEYFDGTRQHFSVPLDTRGTEFQERVWRGLRDISYGETWSYMQLAEHIGRVGGQRAVGRANGQNRIPIIIPCHRVVRADGTLCGYGGGLWRKKWLLEHEQSSIRSVTQGGASESKHTVAGAAC